MAVKNHLDWLRHYNDADVIPALMALEKQIEINAKKGIDPFTDNASISGATQNYVLNKTIRLNKHNKDFPGLYAPGEKCIHFCKNCSSHTNKKCSACNYILKKCDCSENNRCLKRHSCKTCLKIYRSISCKDCDTVVKDCTICTDDLEHRILKKGCNGGPAIIFKRYVKAGKTKIRDGKHLCKCVVGVDANSLYLYDTGQVMPCGKGKVIDYKNNVDKFIDNVLSDRFFGFATINIHVPENLKDKFKDIAPLFINAEIPKEFLSDDMKARVPDFKSKKLIDVTYALNIVMYTPYIKWALKHGLKITSVRNCASYTPYRCFEWFVDEVTDERRESDKDPNKKVLGNQAKLRGNSFYGKMIENKENHKNISYSFDTDEIYKKIRSKHFRGMTYIGENVFEIEMAKKTIRINMPYHIGIAIYQLAKLRMLEFYYDCLKKHFDDSEFELCLMDIDSFYLAIAYNSLEEMLESKHKEINLRDFLKSGSTTIKFKFSESDDEDDDDDDNDDKLPPIKPITKKVIKCSEIVLTENYDSNKLKFAIKHPELFFKDYKPDSSKCQDRLTQLKKTLSDIDCFGNLRVKYFQKDGYARYYAKNNIGFQPMKREVRHTLCSKDYYDIDIENAHPVILNQWCEQNNIRHKYLDNYVKHRDIWLNYIGSYKPKNNKSSTRDFAKKKY